VDFEYGFAAAAKHCDVLQCNMNVEEKTPATENNELA